MLSPIDPSNHRPRSGGLFRFDRRSRRQQQATERLLFVVPAAAAAYLLLDMVLTPTLGGMWGVLLSLFLVGIPVAATFRVASADRAPRQAVGEGIALAAGAALLYFWAFGWPW